MIGNIISTIGRPFLIAHLVPASLFFIANIFLLKTTPPFSGYLSKVGDLLPCEPGDAVILISIGGTILLLLSFLLGLVLSIFNAQIVRIYEGYVNFGIKEIRPMLSCWKAGQQYRLLMQQERIRQRKLNGKDAKLDQHNLSRKYPSRVALVLPTRLGNVIRAFEEYPSKIWGIDPITMWPRLISVLPSTHSKHLADAQTDFTFLINSSFLFFILGLEFLFWLALRQESGTGVPLLAATGAIVLASRIFYRASLPKAVAWGELVRSAFDLYRIEILRQMEINLPRQPITFKEEREIWKGIQRSTFYARVPSDWLMLRVDRTK